MMNEKQKIVYIFLTDCKIWTVVRIYEDPKLRIRNVQDMLPMLKETIPDYHM